MRINFTFFLFIVSTITAFGQQPQSQNANAYPNSYYITLNNDTVKATILYTDIIDLQHELNVLEQDGSRKTFHPGEIKGFGMKNMDTIILVNPQSKVSDKNEVNFVMPYELVNPPLSFIILFYTGPYLSKPFNLYFESMVINDSLKFFINVQYGWGEEMRYLTYYYRYKYYYKGYLRYAGKFVGLLQKDSKLVLPVRNINQSMKKEITWVCKLIADDTLLTNMVKEKKLICWDKHSFNIEMMIDEYNKWKCCVNKSDTSLTLRGILDADRYYKSKSIFWGVTASVAAFIYPGIVIGTLVNTHPPKEKNLNIPANCIYADNEDYLKGYKMRAYSKKGRALDRGVLAGVCTLAAGISIAEIIFK